MPTNNDPHAAANGASQSDVFANILGQLGLDELMAESVAQPAGVVSPAVAAPQAQRPPVQRAAAVLPRSASVVPSIDVISGEISRLAHEHTGIIGSLKTRLLGDALKRQQLATLATRIDALNEAEVVKLALYLLGAIRLAMFQATSDSIDAMYRHVGQYEPGSPAYDVGWQIIELNKSYLIETANDVSRRGEERMLRAADLHR